MVDGFEKEESSKRFNKYPRCNVSMLTVCLHWKKVNGSTITFEKIEIEMDAPLGTA